MEPETVRVEQKLVITRKGVRKIARNMIDGGGHRQALNITIADTANVMFNADRTVAFVSCTLEIPISNFKVDVDRG